MARSTEDDAGATRTAAARNKMRECDAKLARYRAALDSGADPSVVGTWIAQTQAERATAEARLARGSGRSRMTRNEITRLVTALGDLRAVLPEADPDDKAEIYRQLGLRLTYQPETQNGAGRG